jgi:hypothetical protein
MNVIVNIFIYLFQLADGYFLSGNPDHVVIGDNITVTLTCVADDNYTFVTWTKCGINIASIKHECELANGAKSHLYVIYNHFTFI